MAYIVKLMHKETFLDKKVRTIQLYVLNKDYNVNFVNYPDEIKGN